MKSILLIFLAMAACGGARASLPPEAGHLRLKNVLDRPQDGYCLDIVGSGEHVRFDMPMTAHNCKPGLYHDEAVILKENGAVFFPAYNACATVAGLNGRALPGSSVIPRVCDEKSPFLDAAALQKFIFRPDGRLELKGSGLCMTAGSISDSTFSDEHRWRTLFMDKCEDTEAERSTWYFSVPEK